MGASRATLPKKAFFGPSDTSADYLRKINRLSGARPKREIYTAYTAYKGDKGEYMGYVGYVGYVGYMRIYGQSGQKCQGTK